MPGGTLVDLRLADFLGAVSAKRPTPGGGAVASTVGALGAALGAMSVAYSIGKKSLAEHEPALRQADDALRNTQVILMELAEEDAAAYGLMNELQKLPESDPRRKEEWDGAVAASIAAPRAVVGAACDLLRLLESLAPITNRHLRSDLAIAAILADAAARAGAWNVEVNLGLVADSARRHSIENELEVLLVEAGRRRQRIENHCRDGRSGVSGI